MTDQPRNPELQPIDRSGYPLQVAIAHLVESRKQAHGWRVIYEEHAWKHKDGERGFIDVVLEHENMQVVLVVECKRIQKSEWMLLPTNGNAQPRRVARGLRIVRTGGAVNGVISGWADESLDPKSPEAAFCVMSRDSGNLTVDNVGAELVLATEALESEESYYLDRRGGDSMRVYFPAIVTTAPLKVCSFDPKHISLKDGLVPLDAKVEVARFVRFTKQLSTDVAQSNGMVRIARSIVYGQEAGILARAKKRTSFIINAEALDEFLCKFVIDRPR